MGGASAKHDPAVTPIIIEDSNPLSDRGHHLPSSPLQAQATITREDHPGLWEEQAPTMLHQSSLKNSNLLSDNATQLCPDHRHHHLSPPPITGTGM